MNQKLHSSIEPRGEVGLLKLSGVIDEDNGLFGVVEKLPEGGLVIDLSDIERINSSGVQDWIRWVSEVGNGGREVVLMECSPAFMAQVNQMESFLEGAHLKSFYAPYFCPNCELEQRALVQIEEMQAMTTPTAPTCRCGSCGEILDFDEIEETYFSFVQSASPKRMDPRVSAVIAEVKAVGKTEVGGRKIKIRGGEDAYTEGSPSEASGSEGKRTPSVSLPAISSVSSLPSGDAKRGETDRGELGEGQVVGEEPRKERSGLAVFLVVLLLLVAAGLLFYVVFSGYDGASG